MGKTLYFPHHQRKICFHITLVLVCTEQNKHKNKRLFKDRFHYGKIAVPVLAQGSSPCQPDTFAENPARWAAFWRTPRDQGWNRKIPVL